MMKMKLTEAGVTHLLGDGAPEYKRLSRAAGADWAIGRYDKDRKLIVEYYVWVCWTGTNDGEAAYNQRWSMVHSRPPWFKQWHEHFIVNGIPFGRTERCM